MILNIFKQIRKLPYSFGIQFEKDVQKVLDKSLVQVHKKISREERNEWMKDHSLCKMDNNSYMYQPCNTQESPDFIIKQDKLYFVECKTSKQTVPRYNSGIYKDYIYVFSNPKHNTTFYLGSDIMSNESDNLITKFNKYIRKELKKLNHKISKTNKKDVQLYLRPMMIQKGKDRSFFDSEKRKIFENNVYEFLKK